MAKREAVTFETVRQILLALPGVEEGTSYGTPGFRVRKKFLARLREDGETIAVRVDYDERDFRMQGDPEAFFITEHYRRHPAVLVRMSAVQPDDLRNFLVHAWRGVAPKRLVAEYEQGGP